MDNNVINNWFYDESVQPEDMKLITRTFLQLVFAANGGEIQAMGITPTINDNQINTTRGFVYFGETSDQTYIDNTGTNQLMAFVPPAITAIVNANCYLFIKPNIATDVNNRTTVVTGILYTSTNINDEGVNLATITNNVITAINSINPNGATALQKGWVTLSKLDDSYAKLNADNNFTANNNFEKTPTIANATNPKTPSLQGVNLNVLWTILADYITGDQLDVDLSLYAKLLSPLFQGIPRAPTPNTQINTNQLATCDWVNGVFDFDNGVFIFQNGLCFQFGIGTASYGGTDTILPIKFTKTLGAVCCKYGGGGFGSGANIKPDNQTLTMWTYDSGAGDQSYFYIAVGKKDLNGQSGTIWQKSNYSFNIYTLCGYGVARNQFFLGLNLPTGKMRIFSGGSSGENLTQIIDTGRNGAFGNLIDVDGILFIPSQLGWYSNDGGTTFLPSSGLPAEDYPTAPMITTFNPDSGTILVWRARDSTVLYKSTDLGKTFSNISGAVTNSKNILGIEYINNSFILSAINAANNGINFFKSIDDGTTWDLISTLDSSKNTLRTGLCKLNNRLYTIPKDTNLYVSPNNNSLSGIVYYSDDFGINWSPLTGLSINPSAINIGLDDQGNILYMCAANGNLYKSTNGIDFELALTVGNPTNPTPLIYGNGIWLYGIASTIYNSKDGINWYSSEGIPSLAVGQILVNEATNSFMCFTGMGTASGNVYYSVGVN